jgi:hypothetical protein
MHAHTRAAIIGQVAPVTLFFGVPVSALGLSQADGGAWKMIGFAGAVVGVVAAAALVAGSLNRRFAICTMAAFIGEAFLSFLLVAAGVGLAFSSKSPFFTVLFYGWPVAILSGLVHHGLFQRTISKNTF